MTVFTIFFRWIRRDGALLRGAIGWLSRTQDYCPRQARPAQQGLSLVVFGLLLIVPYINLRVEHMLELYRRISAAKK
jgi:hypothetical protein